MSSNLETPTLKLYETVFVLTPVLTNEQTASTVQKFKDFLAKAGADIVYEKEIGLQKLAYPIQHKTTGFYQLFEFRAMPSVLIELERAYRQDESVMRFLTCELNKHAIAYNKKQRAHAAAPSHAAHADDEISQPVEVVSIPESPEVHA